MKDAIDINAVQIHNSHDVKGWPITSTITKLEFRATGVHVEHTKRDGPNPWPNFRPPGWEGDLQYTLWIFLQIGAQWHASGCIQYWQSCDENGGPPEEFAKNWYYAADRWAPMTGHQPAPNERVGFMVTAGDARNSGAQSVQERSNIVEMPFPRSNTVYIGKVDDEPAPAPVPQPAPQPAPSPSNALSQQLTQLFSLVNDLLDRDKAREEQMAALTAKVAAEVPEEHGWKGYAEVSYGFGKAKVPVVLTERIP